MTIAFDLQFISLYTVCEACGEEDWYEVSLGSQWSARAFHGAAAVADVLILAGGVDDNGPRSDVWRSTDSIGGGFSLNSLT